ncbi:MAG: hypothetical protein KatS3mg105_1924 [Gemmatales bacterium]|nr:MAG: hypothetical protein KatS3mg105_1924 [Gemmatales bacterium]
MFDSQLWMSVLRMIGSFAVVFGLMPFVGANLLIRWLAKAGYEHLELTTCVKAFYFGFVSAFCAVVIFNMVNQYVFGGQIMPAVQTVIRWLLAFLTQFVCVPLMMGLRERKAILIEVAAIAVTNAVGYGFVYLFILPH